MDDNKLFDETKVSDGYRRPSGPPWKSILIIILLIAAAYHLLN